ncbi:M15 family metallopeptidase [Sporolactobacillus shoreicorticis]|uniref:D-alanyl-D-alanine dipeptidase n=1 Tax=Sporolactobacillus shoreicorticis TaxID=1923877 RepID=A0ABW5S828_9BACL|nr:M15 family metallopeptidase [Sporolactobacillus shoreicorticis]MCO7125467.1 M15 family metallopeptidase [Sporolactobacillus shoreicorticis]
MNESQTWMKQDEPLVSMAYCSSKINIYPSYFLQKMPGASQDLFLRQGVAEKIIALADRLPEGISFVLIDGWRSIETQKFIYDRTVTQFREAGHSEEQIKKEMPGFVAYPSTDPHNPAPHNTGAAIDLTLANDKGWLEMGTGFDDFTNEAYLDFYEGKDHLSDRQKVARENRRMLKKMMVDNGFVANLSEWWHYSYGERSWAREHQTDQLYGGTQPVFG